MVFACTTSNDNAYHPYGAHKCTTSNDYATCTKQATCTQIIEESSTEHYRRNTYALHDCMQHSTCSTACFPNMLKNRSRQCNTTKI
jgi:hypothetical protein